MVSGQPVVTSHFSDDTFQVMSVHLVLASAKAQRGPTHPTHPPLVVSTGADSEPWFCKLVTTHNMACSTLDYAFFQMLFVALQ